MGGSHGAIGMASSGSPSWMRVLTIVAFCAWVVALFLPPGIIPADRLPAISGILTTLIGATLGNEVFQRSKGNNSKDGKP